MSRLLKWIEALGWLLVALVGVGMILAVLLVTVDVPGIPRVPGDLNRLIAVPPTEVYASDGSLLTRVGGRRAVPLERISPLYRKAVLAAEDDRFFHHSGVDKPALTRATLGALLGSRSRGGSTITMQLARNLFFSFRKTWSRKFREILAAFEIERRFSKEEILAAYCNGIYFGNFAYGVEEAAETYFGEHASNLTLAQAALLAGLPQSPSRYNPYSHPERALARQRWILDRMLKLGWITPEEHRAAIEEELVFRQMYRDADEGSYFLDAVLRDLEEKYGKTVLYHGGLKIYTTLDPALQGYAIEAVRSALADLDGRFGLPPYAGVEAAERGNYPQAALVAVEAATGEVKALIGGRDWQASQFNRATQNRRNMGSSLKPALYLAAFEKLGYTPATVVVDSPIVVQIKGSKDWKPVNFDPFFRGPVVLKLALEKSINSVAARLILRVGPESMIETLHRLGVSSPLQPNYSLALGAGPVSAVEMAGIGASLANLGEVVRPTLIRRVEDARGRVLEETLIAPRPAFDAETVYQLVDMMKGVIEEGTGAGVGNYGFHLPAIGKTGTTNDYRDSWFLGATPRLSAAAWVGYDDNRPMRLPDGRGVTGAGGALPVWAKFMNRATEGEPPRDFTVPPGIVFRYVDPATGRIVSGPEVGGLRVALTQEAASEIQVLAAESGATEPPAGGGEEAR